MRQTADPDTSGRKDAPLPDYGLFRLFDGMSSQHPFPSALGSLTLLQAFAQQFCIDSLIH